MKTDWWLIGKQVSTNRTGDKGTGGLIKLYFKIRKICAIYFNSMWSEDYCADCQLYDLWQNDAQRQVQSPENGLVHATARTHLP